MYVILCVGIPVGPVRGGPDQETVAFRRPPTLNPANFDRVAGVSEAACFDVNNKQIFPLDWGCTPIPRIVLERFATSDP